MYNCSRALLCALGLAFGLALGLTGPLAELAPDIANGAKVAGQERTGRDLTRAKLFSAGEGMRQLNRGGFEFGLRKQLREGSRFVALTMIGPGGKFLR